MRALVTRRKNPVTTTGSSVSDAAGYANVSGLVEP